MSEPRIEIAPDTEDLKTESTALIQMASDLVIASDDAAKEADDLLREAILPLERKIRETFEPRIKQAYELHRGLKKDMDAHLAPLAEAESILKGRLIGYQNERQRAIDAERRKREDAARREAEEARLVEAEKAAAAGASRKQVDQLLSAPVVPAPTIMPEDPLKLKAMSKARPVYDFEIVNAALIPREYLKPDESKIGGAIRAMKGEIVIPGVNVIVKQTAALDRSGKR